MKIQIIEGNYSKSWEVNYYPSSEDAFKATLVLLFETFSEKVIIDLIKKEAELKSDNDC